MLWDKLGEGVYSPEKNDELREQFKSLHDVAIRKKGEHYNFHVVCGRKSGE